MTYLGIMNPVNLDGNFQDWETVTLNKKQNSQATNNNKNKDGVKLSDEALRLRKIENNDEIQKQDKISVKHCQLIQKARLAKKMTQKQLAQKLNIDQNTVAQYENGKIVPNKQILNKIARELNISFK